MSLLELRRSTRQPAAAGAGAGEKKKSRRTAGTAKR
jgi:hypothetical protein